MESTAPPGPRELQEPLEHSGLLDPAYRRRKLLLWGIRQVLTIVLAVVFWEHWWVRWLFVLAALLALVNLTMLLWGGPYLQRRMERARARLDALDAGLGQDDGEDEAVANEAKP